AVVQGHLRLPVAFRTAFHGVLPDTPPVAGPVTAVEVDLLGARPGQEAVVGHGHLVLTAHGDGLHLDTVVGCEPVCLGSGYGRGCAGDAATVVEAGQLFGRLHPGIAGRSPLRAALPLGPPEDVLQRFPPAHALPSLRPRG